MLKNVIYFFKFYSFPILSGILAGTSYIPFPPWALFFCFAPLWHFCLKNSHQRKRLIIGSWLCQFTFSLIGFHWIVYTVHVYGQMPWLFGALVLLVFCTLAHLHIPLSIGLWSFLIQLNCFKREWTKWLLLPCLTSLSFIALPMLFQWNFGYPWFWGKFPAFQTAEIWGFQFLNTLTLFFQLCFLSLRHKQVFKKVFPAGAVLFLLLNVLGYFLGQADSKNDKQTQILMVQHNVGNYINHSGPIHGAFQKTLNTLESLTLSSLKKNPSTDFIVWPEGAYPYIFAKQKPFHYELLQKKVRHKFKTPLVTGATGIGEKNKLTNSLFFLNKDGTFLANQYDKKFLLAFGEFIPGDRWFPALRKYFLGSHRGFAAGKEYAAVRPVKDMMLGLQICYEGLREALSRKLAQKGAQVLLNVTNDSWFGKSSQPYQHLYMTLARSIETRKPMIRLSTTGFSTLMTEKGKILAQSPLDEQWTQSVSLPYSSSPKQTVFVRWGHWINISFLLLIFVFMVFSSFKKYLRQPF